MRASHILMALASSVAASAGCDEPGDRAASQDASSSDTPDAVGDTTPGADVDPDEARAVCDRWRADRAALAEGTWTDFSVARCEPGVLSEPGPDNALRQLNLYRWLAGLPPVTLDTAKSEDAQACALAMHANRAIEHTLPADWACRSDEAVAAARLSNLATVPAVKAIDLYMDDEGIDSLGHRRWLLSNTLGPVGVGSTSQYSCLHVIGGRGNAGARVTTWPPAGLVPIQALFPASWADIDQAGWSVQSDTVPVHRALEVRVERDGAPVEVATWTLDEGYGSAYGLGLRPVDFRTGVGSTYRVTVEGSSFDAVTWEFTPIDCR